MRQGAIAAGATRTTGAALTSGYVAVDLASAPAGVAYQCTHSNGATERVHEAVDVTVGFNFSYFIFKERSDLLAYFRRAYESLAPRGLFVVDLYGLQAARELGIAKHGPAFAACVHGVQHAPGAA